MTFDEIVELAKIKKDERDQLEQIRRQRQMADEIIASLLYSGFELCPKENTFVLKCFRSMVPLDAVKLSRLETIHGRR